MRREGRNRWICTAFESRMILRRRFSLQRITDKPPYGGFVIQGENEEPTATATGTGIGTAKERSRRQAPSAERLGNRYRISLSKIVDSGVTRDAGQG